MTLPSSEGGPGHHDQNVRPNPEAAVQDAAPRREKRKCRSQSVSWRRREAISPSALSCFFCSFSQEAPEGRADGSGLRARFKVGQLRRLSEPTRPRRRLVDETGRARLQVCLGRQITRFFLTVDTLSPVLNGVKTETLVCTLPRRFTASPPTPRPSSSTIWKRGSPPSCPRRCWEPVS